MPPARCGSPLLLRSVANPNALELLRLVAASFQDLDDYAASAVPHNSLKMHFKVVMWGLSGGKREILTWKKRSGHRYGNHGREIISLIVFNCGVVEAGKSTE